MRLAAEIVLREKALDIAEAMAGSSVQGHIQSAKFLYELAEREEELHEGEGAAKLRSYATEWASEQEWVHEIHPDTAETATAPREPE